MWVLWMAFFFQGMALGCWFPSLTNIFGERGLEAWVPIAFMIPPCCALVGPLLTGALADQRFAADETVSIAEVNGVGRAIDRRTGPESSPDRVVGAGRGRLVEN